MSRLATACVLAILPCGTASLHAQVNACTLLSQAEVEAAVGRPVTAPVEERLPQQSGCAFGDPEAPLVAGRVVFRLVGLHVLTFDSPTAAGDVFAIAKRNAASVDAQAGLGDEAFWDTVLHILRIRKGRYVVAMDVPNGVGGLAPAKVLAVKVLAKLP
jgi:hypothetical protein